MEFGLHEFVSELPPHAIRQQKLFREFIESRNAHPELASADIAKWKSVESSLHAEALAIQANYCDEVTGRFCAEAPDEELMALANEVVLALAPVVYRLTAPAIGAFACILQEISRRPGLKGQELAMPQKFVECLALEPDPLNIWDL